MLTGCTPNIAQPTPTPTIIPAKNTPACALEPVVVPTPLAEPPGYTMLDTTIGLHVTGNAQEIDPKAYRLKITGLVDTPLEITLDEIRCLPQISDDPLLVCEGFFEDQATWTGASFSSVLEMAGVQEEAKHVTLVSADGYQVDLSLMELQDAMLAYEVNGETLPILHGFPLRLVVPGYTGNKWIKWLTEIRVE